MKRSVIGVLTIAMMGSLFVGCTSTGSSAAPSTSTSTTVGATGTFASNAAGTSGTVSTATGTTTGTTDPSLNDIATPCIVETVYPTEDVVVADYIVTNSEFGADPTGEKDSTKAIRKALQKCSSAGGGTVWMPAGKYRITAPLTIPGFVTLRGDWQDPDTGNDYGTIILADVPSSDNDTGLFYLNGNGGVYGLTVYYPEQDINNVKPYPFTFYVRGQGAGYMLQSIYNCTVINGYKGIGACVAEANAHEMMTVDTLKGTFLYTAAEVYNQADVGTWKNVTVSPKYWSEAGAGLKAADAKKVKAYTREHTTGLILGDLEWTEFVGLSVSDCRIGIHTVKGKRIEFAGSLFGVTVKNCDYGLQVDGLDTRWGMVVAESSISGSTKSIVNNTDGLVRLADVKLTGATVGNIPQETASIDTKRFNANITPVKPQARLFVVDNPDPDGETDTSSAINAKLQEAKKAGGGIVYLPAGLWAVHKPLTVPSGVELRGAGSMPGREQIGKNGGTVLLVYHGLAATQKAADTAQAAVTLDGNGAGLRSVRFIYSDAVTESKEGTCSPYAYTVRGKGKNVYAVNVGIAGGYNGIDFRDCDNHFIKKMVGCCFNQTMTVGGKGGVIEGCLQNGTALCRMSIPTWLISPVNETTELFPQVFDKITRVNTVYITIEDAKDQVIFNTFAYGINTLVHAKNSQNSLLVNLGSDNQGGRMLMVNGGSLTGINLMRWNAAFYQNVGGAIKLYNRLTIWGHDESATVIE